MGEVIQLSLSNPVAIRKGLKELLGKLKGDELSGAQRQELDALAATLNEAAARGEIEVFSPLAKPSGDKKDRDREPSLLMWAAIDGHDAIVEALLAAGADPSEESMGVSALAMAARAGHVEVVRVLLAAGAEVSPEKATIDVLTSAIAARQEEIIDLLLEAGANVNASSMAGAPLLRAVTNGDLGTIRKLIDAGADVQMKWMAGNNLIASAIGEQELQDETLAAVIRFLKEHEVNVNEFNNFFRTPLMLAVEAGRAVAVAELLTLGADPNLAALADPAQESNPFLSADSSTALILAAKAGHHKIVELLLEAGARPELADKSNLTALQWAKRNGRQEVIDALLAAGAATDEASPQALLAAARDGDLAGVQKAIQAGVDVNIHDEASSFDESIIGPTPLILAAAGGHDEIVDALVQAGADVELQSHPFPTSTNPLMASAEAGHLSVITKLLAAGADVTAKNKGFEGGREQPLHFAAAAGQTEAAKLLLSHGARVNAKSADKETPLHQAASAGSLETVQLLLDAGADPLAKNEYGSTPREWLQNAKHKNSKIGALLEAAEAAAPKQPKPKKKKKRIPAIPHEWEQASWELERPDFTAAADTDDFRRAIELVSEALGVEPTEQDDFPGAKLFQASRGAAAKLVAERREELEKLNAMVWYGLGRFCARDEDTDLMMLIPSADWEQAVAFVQTADPNGGKGPGQVLAGLKQLFEMRPFFLTEIAHDTVAGTFTAPAENSRALAKWMEAFCSDIVYQGVGSVSELARQLKENDRLYFWWD